MLKIKDNVDLKELEKFGFKEDRATFNKNVLWGYKLKVLDNVKDARLYAYTDENYYKRRLIIECDRESVVVDTLFDLIQAGLVEKVKEEN